MSELIEPVLNWMKGIVAGAGLSDGLRPFAQVKVGFAPAVNAPAAFVMPAKTQFPNAGEGSGRNQTHLLTVRLCIVGSEPEQLTRDCLRYVKSIDAAMEGAPQTGMPPYMLRAFVIEHDYGPLFEGKGGLAYWPEIHCLVEVEEVS